MLPACCSSSVKFIIKNLTLCMVLEKSRLPSHSTRQIFDRPKNLTRYFIHKEPFNIFSLICSYRTDDPGWIFCQRFYRLPIHRALLTGKQIQNGTYQQELQYIHATTPLQHKNWDGSKERSHHVVKFALQNFRRSCCSYCANWILDQTGLKFYLYSSIQVFEGLGIKFSHG